MTASPAARHDARLVPAALASWGAATRALIDPGGWWVAAGGGLLVVTAALALAATRLGRRAGLGGDAGDAGSQGGPDGGVGRTGLRGGVVGPGAHPVRPPLRALGAIALAGAAAGSVVVSVAAHEHVRRAGLLGDLVSGAATVEMTGVVASEPAPVTSDPGSAGAVASSGPRYRMVVQAESVTGRGRTGSASAPVLVLVGADVGTAPEYGARVELGGRLAPTAPGDREIALLVARRPPEVRAPPSAPDAVAGLLRRSLAAAAADLGPDVSGLLPALAVGDTTRVPQDLTTAMRTVGLTHIMAVSGAHFAIIGTCVLGLTAVLRVRRRARVLVLVPVMAGFVLLVHPGASVLRAAGMGAVASLGLLLGRPSRAVPALAATVTVLLVADPWLARDYGFVLSVLATAGLVLLTGPLTERARRVMARPVACAISVPVAAQVVCAPVIVLLTPGIAMLAVPANLLAAVAVAPATVLGVLTALVAPWWPAGGTVLAHAAGVPVWWIAQVARRAAAMPGATLGWPTGPGGAALLAVLTLGALVVVLRVEPARPDDARPRRRTRGRLRARSGGRRGVPARSYVVVLVIGVVVLVTTSGILRARLVSSRGPAADWRVVACDVGQGDGLVMRTAPHHAVVVDVGPAGGAMSACLDRLDVRWIDLLVLTHFHADHVGGLDDVLRDAPVARALVSALHEPGAEAAAALRSLADSGIPVEEPTVGAPGAPGATGTAGDVRWTVLWSPPRPSTAAALLTSSGGAVARSTSDGAGEESAPNDAGLVLSLEAPELRLVALADLESGAQDDLVAALRSSASSSPSGPVDVVKIAHHGSASQSSALAELLHARVALVSVGRGNPYGHPARTALDLYEHAGAVVLRTDSCHDIGLSVVGGELVLHATCPGPP
ncbi:MAG TPA: ComEC/Rec2 family competence protein [Cellulomonadaceae bacterium]|nr:ComEC/Rec2 family competence protein [Cellulomonadaceae bacterium]